MLCNKCQGVYFRERVKEDAPSSDVLHPVLKKRVPLNYTAANVLFYSHHESIDALEASAASGCHFCAMLFHGLMAGARDLRDSRPNGEVIFSRKIDKSWIGMDGGYKWNMYESIVVSCGPATLRTLNRKDLSETQENLSVMLQALTARETIPAAFIASASIPEHDFTNMKLTPLVVAQIHPRVFSPQLDTSTVSLASLTLASHWLQKCLHQHRPCSAVQAELAPATRFINISSPHSPYLTTKGTYPGIKYVTLSYEWGESPKHILTKDENVHEHEKQIQHHELPRTFQDAIDVASFLGFEYIWIDSLCIVQNTAERKHQIGIMDQIFRGSTLTLFAAAGTVYAGLAVDRDPRHVKPCKLDIKTWLDGGLLRGSSYVTTNGDTSDWQKQSLFSRGWVAQEQILAPRALIFGTSQIVWRCLCDNANESWPVLRGTTDDLRELGTPQYNDRWRMYYDGIDSLDPLRMFLAHNDPLPDRTPWQRESHFDHWYAFVSNYSLRALTDPGDVLSAIRGLANEMSKRHACESYFGLWREDLPVGLAWYVSRKREREPSRRQSASQDAPEDELPSWSWTSRWGHSIKFRGWQNNHTLVKAQSVSVASSAARSGTTGVGREGSNVNETNSTDDRKGHNSARVDHLSRDFDFVQHDLVGWFSDQGKISDLPDSQKLAAPLTLIGHAKVGIIDHKKKSNLDWRSDSTGKYDCDDAAWMRNVHDYSTGRFIGHVALDRDPDLYPIPSWSIVCLLCTARVKYGEWQLTCLALTAARRRPVAYRRIGLVIVRENEWFGLRFNADVNKTFHFYNGAGESQNDHFRSGAALDLHGIKMFFTGELRRECSDEQSADSEADVNYATFDDADMGTDSSSSAGESGSGNDYKDACDLEGWYCLRSSARRWAVSARIEPMRMPWDEEDRRRGYASTSPERASLRTFCIY